MTARKQKSINLALQGGGAHGAFTWGVLDVLATDPRIKFDGMTATSAGSMNAAVFISGYHHGGAPEGLSRLESFWRDVSELGDGFGAPQPDIMPDWLSKLWGMKNDASYAMMDNLSRILSPYQFNPMNINPLEGVLKQHVDIRALKACDQIKLFVTATHVATGTPKIFSNQDLSIKAIMASAALPLMFQAVKIGRDYYWDGGYMGNPSLWPLFYHTEANDIVIVHINPLRRSKLPKDPATIENRLNEITFNASMLKELRAIAFVQKLIGDNWLKAEHRHKLKNVLIHAVRDDNFMDDLTLASKFDCSWPFLQKLRKAGQRTAKSWLKANFAKLGKTSSVNIHRDYLAIGPDDGDSGG